MRSRLIHSFKSTTFLLGIFFKISIYLSFLTLLGHPILVSAYLDSVAPGSKPVLFGDFSYYWIGERGKRVIKRLVEHYANQGQVAFLTSECVDAKLVLPEAIKCLEVKAA